jgi:hypothetical protein
MALGYLDDGWCPITVSAAPKLPPERRPIRRGVLLGSRLLGRRRRYLRGVCIHRIKSIVRGLGATLGWPGSAGGAAGRFGLAYTLLAYQGHVFPRQRPDLELGLGSRPDRSSCLPTRTVLRYWPPTPPPSVRAVVPAAPAQPPGRAAFSVLSETAQEKAFQERATLTGRTGSKA